MILESGSERVKCKRAGTIGLMSRKELIQRAGVGANKKTYQDDFGSVFRVVRAGKIMMK